MLFTLFCVLCSGKVSNLVWNGFLWSDADHQRVWKKKRLDKTESVAIQIICCWSGICDWCCICPWCRGCWCWWECIWGSYCVSKIQIFELVFWQMFDFVPFSESYMIMKDFNQVSIRLKFQTVEGYWVVPRHWAKSNTNRLFRELADWTWNELYLICLSHREIINHFVVVK